MYPALRSCLSSGYGAQAVLRNCTIALTVCVSGAGGTAAQADPVTVVALGDSLTQGYGLPAEVGFVPQLQAWLTSRGADVVLINAGVSGDTTAGGRSRLDWSVTPDVDAMIVNLGGNDLLRGLDPASSRANLEAILEGATARNLPVLLVGLQAPANYGPAYKAEFDAMYPDLAQSHASLLFPDYFAAIAPVGERTGLYAQYMQADGIHPNADGVARIVDSIGPAVLELLDRVAG